MCVKKMAICVNLLKRVGIIVAQISALNFMKQLRQERYVITIVIVVMLRAALQMFYKEELMSLVEAWWTIVLQIVEFIWHNKNEFLVNK